MNDRYKDMLFLSHPDSPRHPRMPWQDRAAQFSPFAALTGYEAALKETARLTDRFIELDEDRKQEIDRRLFYLQQHREEQIPVKIIYFIPDARKEGGSYRTMEGYVRKIEETSRSIWIKGIEIPIDRIYKIVFLS